MTDNRNILIVDDAFSARETLKGHLVGQNYNLTFASDGIEAFKKVVENPPDVILLDVMMPGMDGIEATKILRIDPLTCHIPIFGLTAVTDPETQTKAIAAGMNTLITQNNHSIRIY